MTDFIVDAANFRTLARMSNSSGLEVLQTPVSLRADDHAGEDTAMWPGQQAVAEFALDAGIEQRDCLRLAKQADGARGAAEDRLVEFHNEGGGMLVGGRSGRCLHAFINFA